MKKIRLRKEHTFLVRVNYLMTMNEPPKCESCGADIMVENVITECRKYVDMQITNHIPRQFAQALGSNIQSINDINYFRDSKM